MKAREAKLRVKKALAAIERMLEEDPVVVAGRDGAYWMSDAAERLFLERGLYPELLMEHLRPGLTFRGMGMIGMGDICAETMRLPGGDTLVMLRKNPEGQGIKLTYKESQVLGLLLQGLSNKEIAKGMSISPGTVNTHLDNIYRKLGCTSRLEACFMALREGIPLAPPSKKT